MEIQKRCGGNPFHATLEILRGQWVGDCDCDLVVVVVVVVEVEAFHEMGGNGNVEMMAPPFVSLNHKDLDVACALRKNYILIALLHVLELELVVIVIDVDADEKAVNWEVVMMSCFPCDETHC